MESGRPMGFADRVEGGPGFSMVFVWSRLVIVSKVSLLLGCPFPGSLLFRDSSISWAYFLSGSHYEVVPQLLCNLEASPRPEWCSRAVFSSQVFCCAPAGPFLMWVVEVCPGFHLHA